ncbi:arylamine N-acetyltransferase family protein [Streptomyces kebangsaanensis]|uniref:Arylamine N-acetyltransferase n=1 Tax=Streptomyces kebangsaanensis TaxID=864058 RepID=A0ABW6KRN4_9ACTN|nr:arylamine N-acetyltransferase [Streptomyces kebangsaanensis]
MGSVENAVRPDTQPDFRPGGQSVPGNSSWGAESLDLDAYLGRIGYDGPRDAGAETLRALQRAHVAAVAFENVDVVLGRGVSLEPADLQRKLVLAGRGGYCFEHNLLFAAALERLGFPVTRFLGRVRRGSDRIRYRAHALLRVEADGRRWLADAGFGDEGVLEPVPLVAGAGIEVGGWRWRVVTEGDQWVLQSLHGDGWFDLYSFREERHFPVDFEVSNYYTAHSGRSTFVGRLIAMRGTADVRYLLRGRELTSTRPDGCSRRTELTGEQAVAALRDTFRIRLTEEEESLVLRHLQSC